MLLEVTTGCKTLNYIRPALRTASVVIGTKLAVTWKCWNRKTEAIFFKRFHQSVPLKRKWEAVFEKLCFNYKSTIYK